MIDTHCHLYDEAFDADRDAAVARALDRGVEQMLLPAIDSHSHARQAALEAAHPHCFRQMMGLHPTSVTADFETELAEVERLLFPSAGAASARPFVAVGEIGLDLYWDKSFVEEQKEALRRQMVWAQRLSLPVCLHVRKAYNELFGVLRDMGTATFSGVMHCFGGSVREAQRAVEMGFHIGIGGVVTFKNATLAEVAKAVPLDRILLETDAPYLSPVPHRGQRNESAYLPLIAQQIASLRGVSVAEVAEVSTASARRLFAL